MIGQAAFRTPFEGNVMTGIDAMWAAMGMRQVVLDRFVWLAVSLTQGIIPPPIQTVFCPYPEVIDKDEEIQAILKLLSGWKKILARFRTSTEASASGMSRISQGDGGSSSSNSTQTIRVKPQESSRLLLIEFISATVCYSVLSSSLACAQAPDFV